MDTPARLNPEAPLFIPVQRFHFRPLPIVTTLPFPSPPPPPPPPPLPPSSLQLLHHHDYINFFCVYPLPQKPPPLHLQPPPSPCTDTSFQTSLILEQALPASRQSPTSPDSAIKTRNPVTSGPRFRPKGDKFRGSRGRKKEQQPEKGVHFNDGIAAPKFGDWNSRERKATGSSKVVWAKKRTGYREILPLKKDEEKTTIMIKNIPSKYTREMLMQYLDKHCNEENERDKELIYAGEEVVSAYDFMYLPIDFLSRLNKGYAFVNFINPKSVWKFYKAFNGKSWECFNSLKRIDIVSAMIQGKEALVDHFERSHFCCDTDEYLPLEMDPPRDGSGAPVMLRPVGNRFSPRRRLPH